MGGRDKAGIELGEQTSFTKLCGKLSGDNAALYVSVQAGYSVAEYGGLGVIPDNPSLLPANSKNPGAILAILSCLEWANRRNEHQYIITTPSDTPYLPDTYCEQLLDAWRESGWVKTPVVAASNDRVHGLHALWPITCFEDIRQQVVLNGERKLSALHRKSGSMVVNFDAGNIDPFFNINTPEDLAAARDASDIS
jgi:molybdopterin-guanine dinucleotide biosynthesis protein A